MIGSPSTIDARTAWTVVPGRNVALSYNADGQIEKETYTDPAGNTIFAVNYTYNANGKVILISCTET